MKVDEGIRWEDVPLSILHAEIKRRQAAADRPPCASGVRTRDYNVAAHVFALFLILILSTLACSFPVIIRRFPSLPVPDNALFISRHFGTGVLIATAFVHLFPTAYTSLTEACLSPFWTDVYPQMAGTLAMVSVMVVVAIEMFFATKGAGHSHTIHFHHLAGDDEEASPRGTRWAQSSRKKRSHSFRPLTMHDGETELQTVLPGQRSPYQDPIAKPDTARNSLNKPLPPEPEGEDSELDLDLDLDLDLVEADFVVEDTQPLTGRARYLDREDGGEENGAPCSTNRPARNGRVQTQKHARKVSQADQQAVAEAANQQNAMAPAEQRLVLQCLMLEAGILFHSVFIGLALSVSTGPAFVVLLIAISFHQTFEGLALGGRIASIDSFAMNRFQPWIMCLMYGITTPIGQAIGLGVQGFYDPNSELGLLMVGITNSISSGLLLYAGLVQLLAEDFLSDASYKELQGKRRLQACGAVVAGTFLMVVVGIWA